MFSKVTLFAILTALISCDAAAIRKRSVDELLPQMKALQDQSTGLCLTDYADDGQLYSAAGITPNLFTLTEDENSFGSFVLTDVTLGKFCVGSEGGGTANQFQCSGDADYVDGGGQEFSYIMGSNLLTYNDDMHFFACGDATTGVNYFVEGESSMEMLSGLFATMVGGGTVDEGTCRTVQLVFVDPDQCDSPASDPTPSAP